MMAAIAMKESGANSDIPDSRDGGIGVFQLTHQRGVTHAQAQDPVFAANYAAKLLAANAGHISKSYPRFTSAERSLATAASYNLGPSKFSGDPARIDEGSLPNGQYGHLVLGLMNCLPNSW